MNDEQIRLLLNLRDSHDHKAASLGCTRWIREAEELVKMGFARKHNYSVGFYSITENGIAEACKIKARPEPPPAPVKERVIGRWEKDANGKWVKV